MKNYNKQMRDKITSDLEDIIVKQGISLHDAIMIYQQYLYKLMDYGQKEAKVYINYLIGLTYTDSYKYYSYKQKNNIIKPIEIDTFSLLHKLEDGSDVYGEVSANPDLFCKMIEASYYYNESSDLSKILYTKSLTEEDNNKLLNTSSLYQLDLDEANNIDLNTIIKSIKRERQYQHKVMMISFDEGIVIGVSGFIKKLFELNEQQAIKLVLEIALKDYRISKYISDKKHIEVYETMTKEDIIKAIKYDDKFIIEIINNIINYCIDQDIEKELEKGNDSITKKLTMI